MKCLKIKNKMSNILNYIKNIFKVLIWPIIFIVGQFLLIIVFGVIFNATKFNDIKLANQTKDNSELTIIFNDYLKTEEYQTDLQNYILDNSLIITIITFVIFCFIFYKNYQKYQHDYNQKLDIKTIFILIMLGIVMNLSYNLILGGLNNIIKFTNNYDAINISVAIYIICTGILGPILEELLFRGIVFNKLKTFNKQMRSILLVTIIFALFHTNLVQMLYAFCLGFILIYVYEKYKNIMAPILVHIASNIMNIFTCMLIINNNYLLNLVLLLLSLLILFIIYLKVIKKDLANNQS